MALAEREVTAFLNVDLDLRAKRGLGKLVQCLESSAYVLHQTSKEASLELEWRHKLTLEQTLLGLVKIVTSLPPEATIIWNSCDYRIFNVGIQAGHEPRCSCVQHFEKGGFAPCGHWGGDDCDGLCTY